MVFIQCLLLGKIELPLETYYMNVIEIIRFMHEICLLLSSLREKENIIMSECPEVHHHFYYINT